MYKRNNQGWIKHLDFILLDVLAVQISFVLAYMLRQGFGFPYSSLQYRILAIMLVVIDILMAASFNTIHNVMKRGYYQEAVQTLKQVMLVFSCIIIYMFTTQSGDEYSRIIVYLTAGFHLIIGYGVRLAWKPTVRRIDESRKKAAMVLVADEKVVPDILSRMSKADDAEYTGVIFSNRDGTGEEICGLPVVANLSMAADYICREWVDEVFVYPANLNDIEIGESTLYKSVSGFIDDSYNIFAKKNYEISTDDEQRDATVATLMEDCRQMSIPVHIRLPISNIGGKSFVEKVDGYNVLTTTSNYASGLQLALKRLMDIVGGIAGSIIALAVIAVVGPQIKKESPGPILFKQTRIEKNGKKFQILKIRSMYLDAEERKKELMKDNRVSDGMMFKMDFDPRIIGNKVVDGKQVTGIGEKIRSGSWDEWP